jgi:hypothetical protein
MWYRLTTISMPTVCPSASVALMAMPTWQPICPPILATYVSLGYVQANTIAANANVVATNIISTTETVSGNLQAGNVSAVGNVVAAGVKTNNYMYANGDPFVSSNYGDANVTTLLTVTVLSQAILFLLATIRRA